MRAIVSNAFHYVDSRRTEWSPARSDAIASVRSAWASERSVAMVRLYSINKHIQITYNTYLRDLAIPVSDIPSKI